MSRNWEILQEPPKNIPEILYVSLERSGNLWLNQRSFEAMARPESVLLMYDKDSDSIGFRKTERRTMNAYPVRSYSNKRYRVSIKNLCVKHEIKYDTTVQFLETMVEEDTLIANLLKTRSTAKKRRSTKPRRRLL